MAQVRDIHAELRSDKLTKSFSPSFVFSAFVPEEMSEYSVEKGRLEFRNTFSFEFGSPYLCLGRRGSRDEKSNGISHMIRRSFSIQ